MNNPLAARFASNTPIMMGADQSDWLTQAMPQIASGMARLEARLEKDPVELASDGFWPSEGSWLREFRPYEVIRGTLMIPIKGMLLNNFGYTIYDWATGYEYITRAFERGLADPDVERVAMIIDSPGGEVAGCFDAVDKIFALKGTKPKPIQAFVSDAAYSAAFAWASVADKISMTRTAGVGSVGVVTAHTDVSAAMEKAGVKIQFIHAGEHKVEGNPYEALSATAKARIQKRINSMYNIFVTTTARNLGIEETAVRETEALTFGADEALRVGFAHEIKPLDEALASFSGALGNPVGEYVMSVDTKPKGPNVQNTDEATFSQADLDKARAEGVAEGVAAEQARISGIMGSEEAKSRPTMSNHLALKTQQSVEDAVALLAVSPEEKTEASNEQAPAGSPGALFNAAMGEGNPNLGAGDQDDDQDPNSAEATLAEFRAVTGYGSKK